MKKVHFSIDDCIMSLKYLSTNSESLDSIFDMDLYGSLRAFNEKYNTKTTMYLFDRKKDFCISQVTNKYAQEFQENNNWLKFSFHGLCDVALDCSDRYTEFVDSYCKVEHAIESFAGSKCSASIIRLHRYQGTKEEVLYLLEQGVSALFTAHDDRCSYCLQVEDMDVLKHYGRVKKDDMDYFKSDILVENLSEDLHELEQYKDKEFLSVFTHEWAFRKEKEKIQRIIEWLYVNEFCFV